MIFGSKGTELMALIMIDDSHTATIAPPPYRMTVGLSSSASHCQERWWNFVKVEMH